MDSTPPTSDKTAEDVVGKIQALGDRGRASLKTYLPVMIDEVDSETNTCRISRLEDDKQLGKNIPLATPFQSDGAGVYYPYDPPEEGYVILPSVPEEDITTRPNGHEAVKKHRHHDLKDAHVIARRHYEDDDIPGHDLGDYLLFHPSESFVLIEQDAGNVEIEHNEGHYVHINEDVLEAAFQRAGGDTMSLRATEEQVVIDGPDKYKRFAANPRTRVGVRDDGTSRLGGVSELGDADGNRVDPTQEDTRQNSPWTYQQVDEPTAPVADPSSERTRNPATALFAGAVNARGFELRGGVLERREEHPDANTSNPTDPTYIDLPEGTDEIPNGYLYWLVEGGSMTLYGWKDGIEVDTGVAL